MIESLAKYLAGFSNDYWRIEKARVIAEAHFDLARIRTARAEVFWRVGDLEESFDSNLSRAVDALKKIARYEQRTRSKLHCGLKALLEP